MLSEHGIQQSNIQQIQIYDANADGSMRRGHAFQIAADQSVAASGVTDYLVDTYTPSAFAVANPYNWTSCARRPDEPSDSVGVRVVYSYHPIIALPGISAITMVDQTVQHLNPTQKANPCPIPAEPINVTARAADPTDDMITWSMPAGVAATSYSIYATDSSGQFSSTPVYNGAGTSSGGGFQETVAVPTPVGPTVYEVTGTNYCGQGDRSLDAPNGRVLPTPTATPTNTPTATATATSTGTPTATAISTAANTATGTPTTTGTATATSTGTSTVTAMATKTATATATGTAVKTATPTATATATAVKTATAIATPTATATPTIIQDSVMGTGTNQFNYVGAGWQHCSSSCPGGDPTLSYDNAASDYVTLKFSGTGIALNSVTENIGGSGAVFIDGSKQADVSFYASTTQSSHQVWSVSGLSAGAHTFKLQVTSGYVGVDSVVISP